MRTADAPFLMKNVPQTALQVVRALRTAGFSAYLVGGCVRDDLLGRVPKDFDIATDALPTQVSSCFPKVIPTGIEHGTVTVMMDGEPIEVTTFRTDADYVDGRRPSQVKFETCIEADLSRRDLTINALAFDPVNNVLVDPFGGCYDLERRLVRCVGRALDRFSEDGLRPMRAVRFATVLDFKLEPETEDAIPLTLSVFAKVAIERVQQELVKLLAARTPARGVVLLRRTGLLGSFLPEVTYIDGAALNAAPTLETRLAVLLTGVAEPREVLARLKFTSRTCDDVANLIRNPMPDGASDHQTRRWMSAVGREALEAAFALAAARGQDVARARALAAENPPLSVRDLALQGRELMAVLGVGPSPKIGEVARFLLARVLEDPSLNTKAGLTKIADTL